MSRKMAKEYDKMTKGWTEVKEKKQCPLKRESTLIN